MHICFHESHLFLKNAVILLRVELPPKKLFNMINIIYYKHILNVAVLL